MRVFSDFENARRHLPVELEIDGLRMSMGACARARRHTTLGSAGVKLF